MATVTIRMNMSDQDDPRYSIAAPMGEMGRAQAVAARFIAAEQISELMIKLANRLESMSSGTPEDTELISQARELASVTA